MALIKCSECGKEIVDGTTCPDCENKNPIDKSDGTSQTTVEKYVLVETSKERKKRLKKEAKEEKRINKQARKAEKKRLKKEKRERNKQKRLLVWCIILLSTLLCAVFYKNILTGIGDICLSSRNYHSAFDFYELAENDEKIIEAKYQQACFSFECGAYDFAYELYVELDEYKDSKEKAEESRKLLLDDIYECIEVKNFDCAERFIRLIAGTKGADEAEKELIYQQAKNYEANYDYVSAKKCFKKIKGYKDVDKILNTTLYAVAGRSFYYYKSSYSYAYGTSTMHIYMYFGYRLNLKAYMSGLSPLNIGDNNDVLYTIEDNSLYFGYEGTGYLSEIGKIEGVKKNEDGDAVKIKYQVDT